MNTKLSFLKTLSIAGVAGVMALPVGAYLAEGSRSLIVYTHNADDIETKYAAASFFSALAKGAPGWPAALTLKTAVSLKTENRTSPYDVLPLCVSPASPPALGESTGGWRASGKVYSWPPAARAEKLALKLSSSALTTQALTDFDELWVDYQDLSPRTPVNFIVQISAESLAYAGGQPRRLTAVAGQTILFAAARLDPGKAAWLPKNSAYSLGRYLRSKPDQNWHYTGLQDMTVIQQRLHTEVTNLEYMDLVFAAGCVPVGVNIRLSAKDNYSAGAMVELGALPEVPVPGGTLWRLNLRSLLKDRFAGKDKAYLQEILVFVKGAPGTIAAARPLEQIIFQKAGHQTEELPIHGDRSDMHKIQPAPAEAILETLPARNTALNGAITRMVVDLRPLRGHGEVFFKNGKILLTPAKPGALSAISIRDVRLVSLGDAKVPAYYGHGEALINRWGGHDLNPLSSEEGVVWPEVRAYFPFAALNLKLPEAKPAANLTNLPLEKQVQALLALAAKSQESVVADIAPFVLKEEFRNGEQQPEGAVRPEDRARMTITDRGVGFFADRPFTKVTSGADGLALEGAGRRLQLSLPMAANVDADTRLFLAMPEGVAKIVSTRLTAVFEDGEFDLYITPNRPVALGRAGRLKSLRFNLALAGGQYRLKFNELALFNPVLTSGAQAFAHKLPAEFTDTPLSNNIAAPAGALISAVSGSLRGSLTPGHSGPAALSWQAPARRPVDWFKGVWLTYRVPARTAEINPCWLNLTLKGDKGSMAGDICPKGPEGRIFITPADIAGRDIGKLLGAAYKVNLGDLAASTGKDFEFGMQYEGYAMASAADAFVDWPVAMAGGENIGFVKGVVDLKDLAEKRIQLTGDTAAMPKLAAAGLFTPVDHPWFQVDSAAVEPLGTLPRKAWEELTALPVPAPGPGILFKLLKLVLYALAGLLAWRYGRKIPWRSLSGLAISIGSSLLALVEPIAAVGWVKLQRCFPAVNIAVLFAALGPGLWYAAGLIGPAIGAATAFFVVLAAGAYWHARRNSGQINEGWWFSGGERLPPFLKYLGIAAALLAVWSAGRARLMPEAGWNLLPALAVVYFFLPWLAANTAVKIKLIIGVLRQRRGYALMVVWASAAFALYAAGFLRPVVARENYYFTFAALAVTFALRYLVAALLPFIGRFSADLAEDIGAAPAKPFFAAAIIGLVATAVLVAAGLQPIAEQAAIAVYYSLVIGVFKEGLALYRTRGQNTIE